MKGRDLFRRFDGLGQKCKPLFLEGNPPPGNDGNGGEPEGK